MKPKIPNTLSKIGQTKEAVMAAITAREEELKMAQAAKKTKRVSKEQFVMAWIKHSQEGLTLAELCTHLKMEKVAVKARARTLANPKKDDKGNPKRPAIDLARRFPLQGVAMSWEALHDLVNSIESTNISEEY